MSSKVAFINFKLPKEVTSKSLTAISEDFILKDPHISIFLKIGLTIYPISA